VSNPDYEKDRSISGTATEAAKREKLWAELSIEEKLERLRATLRALEHAAGEQLDHLTSRVSRLGHQFHEHTHSTAFDGRPVTRVGDGDRLEAGLPKRRRSLLD
jgi:signal transduction histidine kinase